MKQKITKKTLMGEIIEKYPEVVPTLMDFGLHCIGCHIAAFENLEAGFKAHGMDNKQIEEAIKKLNEVVKKN